MSLLLLLIKCNACLLNRSMNKKNDSDLINDQKTKQNDQKTKQNEVVKAYSDFVQAKLNKQHF